MFETSSLLSAAPVTIALLVINGLLGYHTLARDPEALGRLSFKPVAFLGGEWYRIITAGFVHVNLMHLLLNMYVLFAFGPTVEATVGSLAFAAIYLGSDITANLLTLAVHRRNPAYSAAGASGAISGILFSFALFYPLSTLLVFFILPMWAFLFAFLYIVISIYAAKQGGGRIAHEAHLGGALGGLALTLLLVPQSWGIFIREMSTLF